ncbi:hypothetical protein ALNOE001_09250 [Candidatus Methanobinarius endosymbioticus]|uniref:Uncharacterized protein n=1 Tax=Candidatus Methanobinarius endosymbioticus TaxID=2006182 RepID=A0A366MD13_9EURY|nr:hypothetical protein ALNOE001_09250 [Candidatus Methanobinarius endosymbioticus]
MIANNKEYLINSSLNCNRGDIIRLTHDFALNDDASYNIALLPNFDLEIIGPKNEKNIVNVHNLDSINYLIKDG